MSSPSSGGAELAFSSSSFSPPPASEWKREANHRLAAHRARRSGRGDLQAALPGMDGRKNSSAPASTDETIKSRGIADRVAARYEKAPTYSEMLAAEARNAARAAEAAAIAAGEARDAAQAILIGLDSHLHDEDGSEDFEYGTTRSSERQASWSNPSHDYREGGPGTPALQQQGPLLPSIAVEEEEASHPVQALPAKLLEFPRELVAARKARPRLAEGPLREPERNNSEPQLRIFEVESEAISTEPLGEAVLAGWSSIRLDSHSVFAEPELRHPESTIETARSGVEPFRESKFELPLQTASLEDRLMAGVVDMALTTAGFLLLTFAFTALTAHLPAGKQLAIAAAVAFLACTVLYQLLFFSFGYDTPGMRYARIALCTFADGNPTRKAVRRRLGALCFSTCPLGLGLIWALFDHDRLAWHDRMSGTYQRSYR